MGEDARLTASVDRYRRSVNILGPVCCQNLDHSNRCTSVCPIAPDAPAAITALSSKLAIEELSSHRLRYR